MFRNLFITYPVSLMLNVYIVAYTVVIYSLPIDMALIVIALLTPMAVFLQYEFGRKTCWAHHATKGMRLYSNRIGAVASFSLSVVFALYAVVSTLYIVRPWAHLGKGSITGWMVLLPYMFTLIGAMQFLKAKKIHKPKVKLILAVPTSNFMTLMYILMLANAIAILGAVYR